MTLLPTTQVGSFPKQDELLKAKGTLDDASRAATEEFIRRQEQLGIEVLVDGEFYRGDMATDYARALKLPIAGWTRSYDNRYWRKGIVNSHLLRKGPIQVEQYAFAQAQTSVPVKGMLTGPTTLANWNLDAFYLNRDFLVAAWASVVREEAQALQRAGAKYIQIDEPAWGERSVPRNGSPKEAERAKKEFDLFLQGFNIVTHGLDAYTISHFCYCDTQAVYDRIKEVPVDQIDIEMAAELDLGRDSRLLSMMRDDPLTRYKDIAVGVIDIRQGVPVEDVGLVKRRIYTALDALAYDDASLQRIWIHPDCGFRATKDPGIAYQKLEVMMDAVRQVREELQNP